MPRSYAHVCAVEYKHGPLEDGMIKVIEKDGICYEYCQNKKGEIYGVLAGNVGSRVFGPLLGKPLKRFIEGLRNSKRRKPPGG